MPDRTREILEDLEAVRENLLAPWDEIWLSIDHRPESLEEGGQFSCAYNEKMAAFDAPATDLSSMIQQYTSVQLEEREESGEVDEIGNERIIRAIDRETPHSIDEELTFKRPHGFILDGRVAAGVATWNRVFLLDLPGIAPPRSASVREASRGSGLYQQPRSSSFHRDPAHPRKPQEVAEGLYAETNLSANGLRDVVRKLLTTFEIPKDRLELFLREDRNTWGEEA